jgi:hypothetical protein
MECDVKEHREGEDGNRSRDDTLTEAGPEECRHALSAAEICRTPMRSAKNLATFILLIPPW